MEMQVDVRAGEADRFFRFMFEDQIPYASARAINWTALDFQEAERARMGRIFTIRRPTFSKRSVKITEWARKHTPRSLVKISSPGGRSDIFGKFESQTRKGPFRGRSVAVPTRNVPRTGAGIIRKPYRPSQLFFKRDAAGNMVQRRRGGRGRVFSSRGHVFYGAHQTFMIRRPGGRGTIFQRTGTGPSGVVPLYQLVPYVPITPNLAFVATARQTVNERWAPNFTRSFDMAARTAR